jgi:hypothetical protein
MLRAARGLGFARNRSRTSAGDRFTRSGSLKNAREKDLEQIAAVIERRPSYRTNVPYSEIWQASAVGAVASITPFGNFVSGVFTPVLAKHTKSFNLIDTLSVGVDRIQRNFEPIQHQVESWRQTQITDAQAKLIFYSAFVDGKLDAPKSLLGEVHRRYFEPEYAEFSPRTMWSLSNAFTSAFKKLDPVPQFKATAKLGKFLSQLPA